MDALLSMPWLYETLIEDRAAEETATPTMDTTKEQEAIQTGRLLMMYLYIIICFFKRPMENPCRIFI